MKPGSQETRAFGTNERNHGFLVSLLNWGSALISERGSVSRSPSPLPIKALRVADPRSVFNSRHCLNWLCLGVEFELNYFGQMNS